VSNNVFANGREVSCKKADGKTICEFPDVCFTPPENPATPPGVPIPYPNTAFAKDTTSGSKTVKISGQEVMLKNRSYFKTSTGDEAGSAAKKGIISSTNKGKAYFISWSMDVKCEGENVVRHLDMTTNNHASPMATGAAPGSHQDTAAAAKEIEDACKHDNDKKKDYLYVVYRAREVDKNGIETEPPKWYVGRTMGGPAPPMDVEQILNNRKSGHHRTDIGQLKVVCQSRRYAAVRAAEQAHMDAVPANQKILEKPPSAREGKPQIRGLGPEHKRSKDGSYVKCMKAEAKKDPVCNDCGS
jgi:hypothetical protein